MAWRYRDSATGHFVSQSTWTRSHSQGGERYKRESDSGYERAPKQAPTTADEWDRQYSGYDDFDEYYEIETGVDY